MAKAATPQAILTRVPPYNAFTDFTPTLPKLYWDVYSQEERIKALCMQIHKIICYADALAVELNEDTDMILQLVEEFEKFKEGAFDDYYVELLEQWIYENMSLIMEKSIKMVFFGLNDDGYFVAYKPDNWSDIIFDTGMVYGEYTYGRLILQYDVDGTAVISDTPQTVNGMIAEYTNRELEAISDAAY